MRHAERVTQASIEAANNHATSLQHRLAQVVAESSRLHQLFFYKQQCLENARLEYANLGATRQTEVEKIQLIAEKEQETASNLDGISALKLEIEQLTRQCCAYEQTIAEKEAPVQEMSSELRDLRRVTDMIHQLTATMKTEDQNTTS